MNSRMLRFFLLFSLVFVFQSLHCRQDEVRLQLPQGLLIGRKCQDSSSPAVSFLGVPFALPPVNERRWLPPQPPPPSFPNGVWQAVSYPPACAQPGNSRSSEDCLYLNVFAPPPPYSSLLPVKVWIHGGGFETGSSSGYNGCWSSAPAAVVVTIQYRLGAFGFLALKELVEQTNTTGNYGIQDQRMALQWVQQYIKYFGGDKDKVLLYGESAGGAAVWAHLLNLKSAGLFSSAIIESAAPRLFSMSTQTKGFQKGLNKLNCSASEPLDCLRKKSKEQIWSSIVCSPFIPTRAPDDPVFFWGPVEDGEEYSSSIGEIISAGLYNRVPLLIGTNRDEGNLFTVGAFGTRAMNDTYLRWAAQQYAPPKLVNQVVDYYKHTADTASQQISALFNEQHIQCPVKYYLDLLLSSSLESKRSHNLHEKAKSLGANMKVFRYFWTHTPSCCLFSSSIPNCTSVLGATHATEISFVFNQTTLNGCTFNQADQRLARYMSAAWTEFALKNSVDGWPLYTIAEPWITEINLQMNNITLAPSPECQIWDQLLHSRKKSMYIT